MSLFGLILSILSIFCHFLVVILSLLGLILSFLVILSHFLSKIGVDCVIFSQSLGGKFCLFGILDLFVKEIGDAFDLMLMG